MSKSYGIVREFEKTIADYCGAKYAVTVSNGTAALHLACLAAGLGGGGILWTSPNTFIASANCALYCGARPDFVDIDPKTYNMSVEKLEAKLAKAEEENSLPKVVIPVHFSGQSCDMERVHGLSRKYHFTVIEDACHAIGGSYKGIKIGSCRYSDMAVFSFTRNILGEKTITVFNNGNMLRDFTYIDDVVSGVIKIINMMPANYKIYNIGNSRPVKLHYFIEVLENTLQKKAKLNMQPAYAVDAPNTYADVSSFEKGVGVLPHTSIEAGIAKFAAWYRDYYGVQQCVQSPVL